MRTYDDSTPDTGTIATLPIRGASVGPSSIPAAPRPAPDVTGACRDTPVVIGYRAGSESVAAEWVTRRNCADMDPNVFFPNDGAGVIAAQKVCAECPVKDPCREYALANNITHGVWGGTSERQRRRILRDRRRAAKVA